MKRKVDLNAMLELFLTFAKIGFFTFGGGYAMISVIENICVQQKHWITHDEMMQITVIAESTPGPIAINCATYVGYKKSGISGALMTTLGVVLPSFLVIYIISMFLDNFLEITVIANAFRGIKLGVGILILNAAINMINKMKKTPQSLAIMASACVVMLLVNILSLKFSTISLMLLAGTVSLILYLTKDKKQQKGGGKV